MFVLKIALLYLATTLSFAVATPLDTRDTCKPNFVGNAQTIYRSPGRNWINEWTPHISNGGHVTITGRNSIEGFATGEFLVPLTGQASGTYQFKAVADSARQYALQGFTNGDLVFKPIAYSFPNNQEFFIDCTYCASPEDSEYPPIFNGNCVITHRATGKCVTGWLEGVTLKLKACNGSPDQSYIFAGRPT